VELSAEVDAARMEVFSKVKSVGNSVGTAAMVYSVNDNKAGVQAVPKVTGRADSGKMGDITDSFNAVRCNK
jgi:hypothetical protein